MSSSALGLDSDVGAAFIAQARAFISGEFLPKIERCLAELTAEDLWWRANENSNSIGNLLLHLSGNVRQWIVSGLGGQADGRVRQSEFAERRVLSKAELLAGLKETAAEADAVLAAFDARLLLTSHHIQACDVSALEAVFHVVEHFSMHTGQIILLAKLLKERDLRFYDFSSGAPVHTWQK